MTSWKARNDELRRQLDEQSDRYHRARTALRIIDQALLTVEYALLHYAPPAARADLVQLGESFSALDEHVEAVILEIEGP